MLEIILLGHSWIFEIILYQRILKNIFEFFLEFKKMVVCQYEIACFFLNFEEKSEEIPCFLELGSFRPRIVGKTVTSLLMENALLYFTLLYFTLGNIFLSFFLCLCSACPFGMKMMMWWYKKLWNTKKHDPPLAGTSLSCFSILVLFLDSGS